VLSVTARQQQSSINQIKALFPTLDQKGTWVAHAVSYTSTTIGTANSSNVYLSFATHTPRPN
jgi:hypothetical protein